MQCCQLFQGLNHGLHLFVPNWGGRGGILPRENFVILTSQFSNFEPLLLIFFEITEVSYILG